MLILRAVMHLMKPHAGEPSLKTLGLTFPMFAGRDDLERRNGRLEESLRRCSAEVARWKGEVEEANHLAVHCEAMWKGAEREAAKLRRRFDEVGVSVPVTPVCW